MTIETSPGRFHDYWRLTRAVAPGVAEELNRRLTQRIGGDSGWALTKRLRPPGSRNFKHPDGPVSRMVAIDEERLLDPDELDRVLPRLAEVPGSRTTAPSTDDAAGEPPVRLGAAAMRTWRGERPTMKEDGSGRIDRTASLWAIARVLWKHNASKQTIIAALAERDTALGWDRYTDRPAEYARVAAEGRTGCRPILRG